MKSIKFIYITIILFLACNCSVYAQEWVRIYKNYLSEYKTSVEKASGIAIDSYGKICVVGNCSGNEGKSDICIIKYNTNGDTLWIKVYNGNNSEDKAYAITVDDLDNIYIGGYTSTAAGNNILVLKYDSDGTLLWSKIYDGAGNGDDKAFTLKLDNLNNLYVCGYSTGIVSGADFITLKYDTYSGDLLWAKTYNGTGNSTDIITAISIGADNNLVVSGNSMGTAQTGSEDIVTIKYNASNGNQLWNKRYDASGIALSADKVYAMTIDNGDNIYMVGNSRSANRSKLLIISYDNEGNSNWEDYYVSPYSNIEEYTYNIECTNNNYVLVSGTTRNGTQTGDEDFLTIALHSNNGNFKWANTYNGPNDGIDVACTMSLSETENEVYVSGYSSHNTQNTVLDLVTLKYKLSNGSLIDSTRFNNSGISKESPVGMKVDHNGNIFITGWTVKNNTTKRNYVSLTEDSDILTIKYSNANYSSPGSYKVNNNVANSSLLYQNFPNPFNPITVIRFNLANSTQVELKIYDMLGKEVQTLVSGYLEAGEHNFQFNGGNLSSGIYFYELNVNGVKDIKKMMLVK